MGLFGLLFKQGRKYTENAILWHTYVTGDIPERRYCSNTWDTDSVFSLPSRSRSDWGGSSRCDLSISDSVRPCLFLSWKIKQIRGHVRIVPSPVLRHLTFTVLSCQTRTQYPLHYQWATPSLIVLTQYAYTYSLDFVAGSSYPCMNT